MSKTMTVVLPDGWDDGSLSHLVLVSKENAGFGMGPEYGVNVLKVEEVMGQTVASKVVEEVGCGGSLNALMVDAARVVRTGTAVVKGA